MLKIRGMAKTFPKLFGRVAEKYYLCTVKLKLQQYG